MSEQRRWSPCAPSADPSGGKCFAVSDNDEQGAIRSNLIGRDMHGRVRPGAEYEEVLAYLREALVEFENVKTREPAQEV